MNKITKKSSTNRFPLRGFGGFFLSFLMLACFAMQARAQTLGDYRSNGAVTFAAATNWQTYDGAAWVAAVAGPISTDGVITIRSNNGATVTADIDLDQIVVEGFLRVNASITLTLLNGPGDELTLQGTGSIDNRGTINNCAGGAISPANAFTSTAWAFPKGTYNDASTTEPTTEATALNFNQASTTATIYWANGDGKRRVVVLKPTTAVSTIALTDNTVYPGNATYGSGAAVDGGFVVFNGVGNEVNVTGLTDATTYHIAVFEYNGNCANALPNYKTGTPLAGSFLTGDRAFITTWQTTTNGESITIPTTGGGYNYDVNWGDASTSLGQTGNATHTYTTAGTHTVTITGAFPSIFFNNATNPTKIRTIQQWGSQVWTSMNAAFWGCTNLTYTATDVPNLSAVTNMTQMFRGCTVFDGNIGAWNTSAVTAMSSMFRGCSVFNGNIGSWNTAAVTTMSAMFQGATAFNQNIGAWNTSCLLYTSPSPRD